MKSKTSVIHVDDLFFPSIAALVSVLINMEELLRLYSKLPKLQI
ncbi:hypothetical protein ACIQZG_18775 [Lysinibacillus sp. NPDC096418]